MSIFHTDIIILAAGASTRLGRPKQLLPWQGVTLLQHAVQTALTVAVQPVVVTGANGDHLAAALDPGQVKLVFNQNWQQGIASSIRCGLKTLLNRTPEPDQVIFMVCDQPFVTAGLLLDLINEQQKSRKPIVASAYAGTLGIPALFDKSLFSQLLDLQGDTGAKRLIQQYGDEVASVAFPEGMIDIDTEGEYKELVNKTTD
ncbi:MULTISPECIES: nucleotidyltransferase family protein [Niastella]|uniref:Nucleotidyltransferase family protein n=1 Tax=Niastella soli TaxID=2821487 RepID=A0ABS3Z3Z3_9BACT|nr:nucleotidyltransferase family protein [Niastella soli]MBO9204891.1 nucleotidyltransferase family protein [Niastella soli]